MFVILYLLPKGVRIPVHQGQNSMIPLLSITLKVMTPSAVTSITRLVQSEAITVKFKTFCFFAIAKNLFVWVDLLDRRSCLISFFDSDLLLLNLLGAVCLFTFSY